MAKGLIVRFFKDAVHLKAKSETEGRPIYEDRDFVSVIPFGDKGTELVREVRDEDKNRWPQEWERYQRGDEVQMEGTPLKEWPQMKASQIKMLEHFNIYVVEQLAEIDDATIQRLGPGARDLKLQAEVYLKRASETAAPQALAVENARLKDEMEALKEQFRGLSSKQEETETKDAENEQLKSQVSALQEQINDLVESATAPKKKAKQTAGATA